MSKMTLELPTMYADHHVVEVRRILAELSGVESVVASSALRLVEVTYDPAQVNELQIQMALDEAGYLGEWNLPMELEPATQGEARENYFRHTEIYEKSRQVVRFAQNIQSPGRPLWPCPGMGVIRTIEEE